MLMYVKILIMKKKWITTLSYTALLKSGQEAKKVKPDVKYDFV